MRGCKKKWDEDEVHELVKSIPSKKRKTYRALAAQLEIPLTTVWKMKKKSDRQAYKCNQTPTYR
jgi:uncharacterized protein YdbL (DUF1318 family)